MRYVITLLYAAIFTVSGCSLFKKGSLKNEPKMILVEGGSFIVGDIFEKENSDALPAHQVYVESFYIGKYEVTYDQYDEFARATGRPLPEDNGDGRGPRAVVYVDWNDAESYCQALGYRLPTEMEWEYAARSRGKKHMYSGTNTADSLKFYAFTANSEINTALSVGLKKPNELGIYDMSGNVFEWIDEFYQFYSRPDLLHDHENDGIRLIRGGSFSEQQATNRTYWRVGTLKDVKTNDIGFRCAASAK